VQGDGFTFAVTGLGAKFQLEVSDASAVRWLQTLDLTFPNQPNELAAIGEADAVKLTWSASAVLTGGTASFTLPTVDFSSAPAAVKSQLLLLNPGDVVKDGGGSIPIGAKASRAG
jgi:hypothetical protein